MSRLSIGQKLSDPVVQIKFCIWAYFYLLIFEGALRKWFLPGLATPLLLIRDPFALWAVFTAIKYRYFPKNFFVQIFVIITVIGVITSLGTGHGNIFVALYGARIFLIHFPLILVMGYIFTREDVIKMTKAALIIGIPMLILIALQFYSPQSAWVNRGIGGSEEGAGFAGAEGYFRPPGTFSFTTGLVQFYSMVGAFLFYYLLNPSKINKILLLLAAVAVFASIPLSISRSLLFNILVTTLFTLIAIAINRRNIKKLFNLLAIALLIFVFISRSQVFQDSFGAFNSRFTSANEQEGGAKDVLLDRYFGGMFSAMEVTDEGSIWGKGLGMGSNVGASLLTTGSSITFLISEGEWGRLIGEQGPILGLLIIILRIAFSVSLAGKAFRQIGLGNVMAWLMVSYGFMTIIQGQWAQPTPMGFTVIVAGLTYALTNEKPRPGETIEPTEEEEAELE